MPTTTVKNDTQAQMLGAGVGTRGVPIFVPDNQDPQAAVDQWHTNLAGPGFTRYADFYFYWSSPDHDYKNQNLPESSIYDAYGNFMYGATGTAAKFPESTLQGMADRLHGGCNDPINTRDIQSGIDAIKNGGVIIVVPVQSTWNGSR